MLFKNKWITVFIFGILIGLCFGAEAITEIFLDDIEDCNVPSPNDGDVLTYDTATANWTSQAPTGNGVSILDDLIDCNVPTPNDNDVLTYDTATSNWTSEASVAGKNNLAELNDVDVTGVQDKDFLQYNGTHWLDFDLFNTANTWLQHNTFEKNIILDSNVNALVLGDEQETNILFDGTVFIIECTDVPSIIAHSVYENSAGVLSFIGQSACRYYSVLPQTILTKNWTILELDMSSYDNQDEWWIEWYDYRYCFIPKILGMYHIDYAICLESTTSGVEMKSGIFVNNDLMGGYDAMYTDVGEYYVVLSGSDCLFLGNDDVIDLRIWHDMGDSLDTIGLSPYCNYIAIHKLS